MWRWDLGQKWLLAIANIFKRISILEKVFFVHFWALVTPFFTHMYLKCKSTDFRCSQKISCQQRRHCCPWNGFPRYSQNNYQVIRMRKLITSAATGIGNLWPINLYIVYVILPIAVEFWKAKTWDSKMWFSESLNQAIEEARTQYVRRKAVKWKVHTKKIFEHILDIV